MRHHRRLPSIAMTAVTAASIWLAGPATADEVVIEPVADATLYESSTGDLANGAGQHLFTGVGNAIKRGVLRFDVASSVPVGSTIDAVALTLNMSRTIAPGNANRLHRVTTSWTEGPTDASGQEGAGDPSQPGDVTWIHTTYDSALWSTPGGDFVATESASIVVAGIGSYTWGSTPEMVADVQLWLDTPSSNHGWLLRGDEIGSFTAKRFDTREHPEVSVRPALRIVYTPAPPPTPTPPGPAVAIDTVTPAGIVFLVTLLALAGVVALRRW